MGISLIFLILVLMFLALVINTASVGAKPRRRRRLLRLVSRGVNRKALRKNLYGDKQ